MRILVADPVALSGIRQLEGAGFTVDHGLESLKTKSRSYHGLIIRSATIADTEIIENVFIPDVREPRIIARAGIGFDNIDLGTATKKNILVINVPRGNENAVAEHAIGLMLALLRKIPYIDSQFKKSHWVKSEIRGKELCGRTLGIIGFGRIGRLVAEKAKALGLVVRVYDPYVQPMGKGIYPVDFATILRESDIISLHIPKTKETKDLLNREVLEKIKPGAVLINTARGGIVDEIALYDLLQSGKIAGAAFDVFEKEPPETGALYQLPTFIGTQHTAGQTEEAEENIAKNVAETVIGYLAGGVIRDAVNTHYIDAEGFRALTPYRKLAKNLVLFLTQYFALTTHLEIIFEGDFSEGEREVLERVMLREFLRLTPLLHDVGYINARKSAQEFGLLWQVKSTPAAQKSIGFVMYDDKTSAKAFGKICEEKLSLLTRVDDFILRGAPLSGSLLIVINANVYGVYGEITTLLGQQKLNIEAMNTCLSSSGEFALAVINLGRKGEGQPRIPTNAEQQIANISQVKRVRFVSLP